MGVNIFSAAKLFFVNCPLTHTSRRYGDLRDEMTQPVKVMIHTFPGVPCNAQPNECPLVFRASSFAQVSAAFLAKPMKAWR